MPYTISHLGGSNTVYVNQRINGGQWVDVGTYSFAQGTTGYIQVGTTNTNGYVVADAVLFEQVFQ